MRGSPLTLFGNLLAPTFTLPSITTKQTPCGQMQLPIELQVCPPAYMHIVVVVGSTGRRVKVRDQHCVSWCCSITPPRKLDKLLDLSSIALACQKRLVSKYFLSIILMLCL